MVFDKTQWIFKIQEAYNKNNKKKLALTSFQHELLVKNQERRAEMTAKRKNLESTRATNNPTGTPDEYLEIILNRKNK